MDIKFEVTGFEVPDFESWSKELAAKLKDRVQMRTPVRTGALKDSVYVEVSESSIEMGSDLDYAPHVEYGTIHMSGFGMFRMAMEEADAIANSIPIKMVPGEVKKGPVAAPVAKGVSKK